MDWMLYIEHMIVQWGAFGVFWGSVLEEVIVFIPSSLVQSGAGFFLLSGNPFSFVSVLELFGYVVLPATLGVTLGSLPVYYIAFYGGYPALKKWGKYFLIKESYITRAEEYAKKDRHIIVSMGLLRVIPIIPSSVASALAGLIRMKIGPYLISTAGGVFVRALYLGIVGWVAGSLYKDMMNDGGALTGLGVMEGILLLLIVIGYGISRYAKKKKARRAQENN
jgi:membrane protein DedA with SNARE-associated domain